MMIYAIFALGIVLLSLVVFPPWLPILYRFLGNGGAWHHAISDRNQRYEASMKEIFEASILLITVAIIAIDMNLPISLSHFKFLPISYVMVVYAMFALGIVLLLFSLVLPWLPISYRCLCLNGARRLAIGGRNQRHEARQKDMFKVSVLLITVAVITINANLPVSLSHFKFLLTPYLVVVYAMFAAETVLLLLSMVLPRLPISYRYLHLDGARHPTNGERNQRHEASQKDMFNVSVLLITVAVITIDANVPISLSHFKFLSTPYLVVVYAMFALGIVLLLLSMVLHQLPIPYRYLCLDGARHPAISGRNQRHEASQKDMFNVSVLLITVAVMTIDANVPIGLSHFKFLSTPYLVVVYAMFALGIVLLLLSMVLHQLPISYRYLCRDGARHPAISGRNQRHEASQKDMFNVSVLLITVAVIVIDANLPIDLSHSKFLSIPYVVVVYAMFALGIMLLLLSLVPPRLPISYRCIHLDGGRNQRHEVSQKDILFKVSILLITVAAIAIDTNLPIGLPHFKFLSIPYAMVIYAMFALGTVLLLLSLLLPQVPASCRCLRMS